MYRIPSMHWSLKVLYVTTSLLESVLAGAAQRFMIYATSMVGLGQHHAQCSTAISILENLALSSHNALGQTAVNRDTERDKMLGSEGQRYVSAY